MANQNLKELKSDFFTLKEFIKSSTATRLKIDNTPNAEILRNLQYGVQMVLDPLRRIYQQPIFITSGYRCEQLNKAVGGVTNSWHTKGNAADILILDKEEARELFKILKTLPSVDTVLFEHSRNAQWIHVQWDMTKTPRHHYNFNYRA